MKAKPDVSHCDLAIEAHETLAASNISNNNPAKKGDKFSLSGVKISENSHGSIKVTRVTVESKDGSEALGKPIGQYTTIETSGSIDEYDKNYEELCRICADEIIRLAKPFLNDDDTVLAVGLGNRRITADALGPKVISSLMITRHLKEYISDVSNVQIRPVCAITPGVLGTTGIETNEIVKSVASEISPALIIVIDALCSANIGRINSTVQITDTGITPGGGVGNNRKTINEESLGIPVIAIGVPTVVDAATIALEGIETIADTNFEESPDTEADIRSVFRRKFGNMIVTPKDVDSVVDDISSVIANGINIAMHKGISLRDINMYI